MTDQEINEAVARELGWRVIYNDDLTDKPYATIFQARSFNIEHGKERDYMVDVKAEKEIPLPDYCHDIKAAWEIVEHLVKQGQSMTIFSDSLCGYMIAWKYDEIVADAATAPVAICLAFLKLTNLKG